MIIVVLMALTIVSEELVRDVSIELELPEEWNKSEVYENLAVVRNKDHVTGTTDKLDVELLYQLFFENNLNKSFETTTSLNRFTRSNTGVLNITKNGTYELCVEVNPLNFNDPDFSNNKDCEEILIGIEKEETEEECGCELTIDLNEKLLKQGETQRIKLNYCEENSLFKHNVSYWVENVNGEITKTKLETINPSVKSYTPNSNLPERGFVVKAEVKECNLKSEEIFILYNSKETKPYLDIEIEEIASFGDELIVRVKGNKGDTNKRVLSLRMERDNTKLKEIRLHINEGNFDFQIPYNLPEKSEEYTGMYSFKAEGLDLDTEERVFLKGEKIEEEKEPAKIENIYTRQQIFNGKINLYVRTTNTFSNKIIIKSSAEEKEIIASQNTVNTTIKINQPNEIIKVELYENNNVIDEKAYQLELEDRTINTETSTTNNTASARTTARSETEETNKTWIYLGIAGILGTGMIILKPKGF